MKRAMRSSGSKCFSLQAPRSCGEIRPSGATAAASVKTSAAPPTARDAEMGEMPVVGEAVVAGILAHRRNADAIGERDVAQAKRAEEVRHGGAILIGRSVVLIVSTAAIAPQGAGARAKNRDIPLAR